MGMPSPFELGRATANSIGGGFDAIASQSNMDAILGQALQSDDPNIMDKAIAGIMQTVSPQNQPAALHLLKAKQDQMNKKKQAEAYQKAGFDPSIMDLPENIQKEVIKSKTGTGKVVPQTQFQKTIESESAKEYVEVPKLIHTYDELIKDLSEMKELTNKASFIARGITDPAIRNRYKAIRNKITLNRAGLQKGVQSDKDMALILGEVGDIGDIGGSTIFDTLIDRAKDNKQFTEKRGQEIQGKFLGEGEGMLPPPSIQPTVQQAQENIFKGKPTQEFVSQSGNKISVSQANNKQIISALSQGYAPEGYVSMMAPDGFPDAVPIDEVQNELNKGSIIIYGN